MRLLNYALELLGSACRTLQYISWLLQPLFQESKGHQLPHNLSNIPGTPVFLGKPDYLKSSQPQILGLHLELQVEGGGGGLNVVHGYGLLHKVKEGWWRKLGVCNQRREGVVANRHFVRLPC